MQLKDTQVSIELEAVEYPERPDMADGQPVTVTRTGDDGPNGHPIVKVAGKFPAVVTWLSKGYGMLDDDIMETVPSFQLENLIP